jgi:hypothetical protein
MDMENILWKDRDMSSMVRALQALGDLKSKESVPLVIPLLRHKESTIRAAAAHLISGMPTRESVVPLAEALEFWAGTDSPLTADLGKTLAALDDTAALPAVRRAIKKGEYDTTCWTLGCLGERDDFELMFEILRDRNSQAAAENLLTLVERSNKPYEKWMSPNRGKATLKKEWLSWWEANKADFRVVKTATEAFKRPSTVAVVENADPIADLGVATVELPKGFVHRIRRGIDSRCGWVVSGDGKLWISYDIGHLAGVYAESVKEGDIVTSNTEKANGLTALIVVAADGWKRVTISFPKGGPANFIAGVQSDDQIEIVRKLAMSFKLKPQESKK